MRAAATGAICAAIVGAGAARAASPQRPDAQVPAQARSAARTQPVAEPTSAFDPLIAFAPFAMPEATSPQRSSGGAPGAAYWQNRADYDIAARLDPVRKRLTATETITYANRSPDTLDVLWLQLDQNTYRPDARAQVGGGDGATAQTTGGYDIARVEVADGAAFAAAPHLVSDTRMQVRLAHPLRSGASVRLRIAYSYTVPGLFGGRTAWVDTRNGPIFDIAQWYPRMAVYDDVRGWDTLPYLGQEFYLEYGDFTYAVTVPADWMVMGTGELSNADEVLSAEQRRRLAQARGSDATVLVRTPSEAAAPRPPAAGERTWRWRMASTRDVAFSASPAFVWDAARINLPGGRTALAESVYPVESAGAAAWSRSTEYLKDAVQRFSARWFPYPYPTAVNVAGGASGMEYPGLAFDGIDDKGKALFWITAHEIGHTWFPMTVGFDERRDAWMDEGFNTFIDTFESDDFMGGVYGPKRDAEYAPQGGDPVDAILPVLADREAPPILARADLIPETYRHPVTYFKSALGLTLLRDVILGPDRFDPAFRKFIADWAFKHPKPADFFRAMQSEGGEDLSWWWTGWYAHNWSLDLAVTGVSYVDGDPAKGARVALETRDKLVMPAVLEVAYADGRKVRLDLPVETWRQGGRALIAAPAGVVASATVDPDHRLPDRDRSDDTARPAAR